MLKKTLKITFSGYHFTPGEMGEDGVYDGEWDNKLITKTFSIPEDKVNPALVPNAQGKVTQAAFEAAYNNAQAMLFDGIFDMGDITPVLASEGEEGPEARGLAQMYAGAAEHPTAFEIYWEVVEDQPLMSE